MKKKVTLKPRPNMIVSNGRIDFIIHEVTDEWIYGVQYPTANRGNVRAGLFSLIKVTRDVWQQSQAEIIEVTSSREFKRGVARTSPRAAA